MLERYDITRTQIWLQHDEKNKRDYVLVYHEIGPIFAEKIQTWDDSEHSYDIWFRKNIMAAFDIADATEMNKLDQLIDFSV